MPPVYLFCPREGFSTFWLQAQYAKFLGIQQLLQLIFFFPPPTSIALSQQCRVCSENEWHCGPVGIPDQEGVRDADFVLYVSALTTERCGQENIIAYAAYCQLEAEMDR